MHELLLFSIGTSCCTWSDAFPFAILAVTGVDDELPSQVIQVVCGGGISYSIFEMSSIAVNEKRVTLFDLVIFIIIIKVSFTNMFLWITESELQ